jgi:hypothetical protein
VDLDERHAALVAVLARDLEHALVQRGGSVQVAGVESGVGQGVDGELGPHGVAELLLHGQALLVIAQRRRVISLRRREESGGGQHVGAHR